MSGLFTVVDLGTCIVVEAPGFEWSYAGVTVASRIGRHESVVELDSPVAFAQLRTRFLADAHAYLLASGVADHPVVMALLRENASVNRALSALADCVHSDAESTASPALVDGGVLITEGATRV